MHRFNVATFVNILVVGLVALTISLFVFGGRKPENAPLPVDALNAVAVVETSEETADAVASSEENANPSADEATLVADATLESAVAVEADNFGMNALFSAALQPEADEEETAESIYYGTLTPDEDPQIQAAVKALSD